MLCRYFHHVSPWTEISSAPAMPSSWGPGGWQGFPTRCEDPHQPPAPVMLYQALLADAWPLKSVMKSSVLLPDSLLLPPMQGVVCCAGLVRGQGFLWSDCDVPQMRPPRALVWWLVSSMCPGHSQLLGQGSGSWRDQRWPGILHLQSKLSVLSPRSLSLCCYHTYNNKQRKQAISRSIRGSEISKLI